MILKLSKFCIDGSFTVCRKTIKNEDQGQS